MIDFSAVARLPATILRGRHGKQLADILKNSAILIAVRIGGMGSGLVLMIMLARTLAPSDFGQVTLTFSIALIGGVFASLNYGAGALRFLTGAMAHNDKPTAAAYMTTGRRIVVWVALLLWTISLIAGVTGVESGSSPGTLPFLVGLTLAPLFGWLRVNSAYVAALGFVLRSAIPNIFIRQVLMAMAVAIAILFAGTLTLAQVLWIYATTLVCVVLLQFFVFRPALTPFSAALTASPGNEIRAWVAMGVGLLVPTLFLELSVDTIVVLAAVVLEADQIAVLGIVLRIQGLILFGVTSINMVIGPKIADAHGKNDRETVNQLLALSWHLKLWPSIALLGGLAVFGDEVLGIFGPDYSTHIAPLLLASLTPVIMALMGPVVLFVTILGLQRLANRVFSAAIALLALLIFTLGSLFGVIGVTTAIVGVWLFWHLTLSWVIRQQSGYETYRMRP